MFSFHNLPLFKYSSMTSPLPGAVAALAEQLNFLDELPRVWVGTAHEEAWLDCVAEHLDDIGLASNFSAASAGGGGGDALENDVEGEIIQSITHRLLPQLTTDSSQAAVEQRLEVSCSALDCLAAMVRVHAHCHFFAGVDPSTPHEGNGNSKGNPFEVMERTLAWISRHERSLQHSEQNDSDESGDSATATARSSILKILIYLLTSSQPADVGTALQALRQWYYFRSEELLKQPTQAQAQTQREHPFFPMLLPFVAAIDAHIDILVTFGEAAIPRAAEVEAVRGEKMNTDTTTVTENGIPSIPVCKLMHVGEVAAVWERHAQVWRVGNDSSNANANDNGSITRAHTQQQKHQQQNQQQQQREFLMNDFSNDLSQVCAPTSLLPHLMHLPPCPANIQCVSEVHYYY